MSGDGFLGMGFLVGGSCFVLVASNYIRFSRTVVAFNASDMPVSRCSSSGSLGAVGFVGFSGLVEDEGGGQGLLVR